MESSLKGKVVLITGGSKGTGRATALAYAAAGASVVVNYSSDSAAASEVVSQIGSSNAIAIKADVSTVAGNDSLVSQTIEKFGRIDVLIMNAGILPMKDLEHTTEQDFDATFALNVKGPYFLCQKAAPYMSLSSHIIFLSTTLCSASTITPTYLLYLATKGAIEQMVRAINKDLGRKGIFVNAVAPGPTGTELFFRGKSEEVLKTITSLNPQGRIGTPEDVAEVLLFLGSARWISGQVVRVNGGMA